MQGPLRLTKKDLLRRIKVANLDSEIQATDILECVRRVLVQEFDLAIAKAIQPLFFRNGTVTLETASSLIAEEVRLKETQFKDAINQELGTVMVKYFLWRIS